MTAPATPTSFPSAPGLTGGRSAALGAKQGHQTIGRILALVCIAVCGVWAFMPLGPAQIDVPQVRVSAAGARPPAPAALDLAAFNTPLWVAPAPPPPAVVDAPPLPPPPLKWQLLAILREDTGYRALVYDPDTGRLLVLREGDVSGPQRVDRITATAMDVRGGDRVRTLALRDAVPGGRP